MGESTWNNHNYVKNLYRCKHSSKSYVLLLWREDYFAKRRISKQVNIPAQKAFSKHVLLCDCRVQF